MKKTLLFTLSILMGQICLAQSYGDNNVFNIVGKPKNHVLMLGPKVGVGMTSISGQPEECDLMDGGSLGFAAGIAAKARFGRASENSNEGTGMVGAAVELKYRQAKAKTIADDDLSLGYLEVPVMFQFYPMPKHSVMNGFYIEAGPEFAMLMSKSPDVLDVPLNQTTAGLEALKFHTGDLKGGDLRFAVGVGYTLPNTGCDVNVRYHLGTSELSENVLPCKVNVLEFSIAWMFDIAKF